MNLRIARLQDICEIRSGGTPSRSRASFYGGDIPWAKIGDIERANGILTNTEESITPAGLDAIRGRLFDAGTLLFAIYGSIGKMAFAGRPIATNQAILGLSFRDGCEVFPRYVYHWLLANNARFLGDGQGIAQKNLSAGYLRELEICLPPLDEQRRIAAVLDKVNALRRKRRCAIDLLDSLMQSIFWDMFGDPIRNPRGWTTPQLDTICERLTVGIVVKPASYYAPSGAIAVRSLNIRENAFDLENIVFVSPEDNVGALAKSRIFKDDVVVVRTGQPGKAAVVTAELDNSNAIDILIVSPNKSKLNPQYLCDLLNSSAGKALVLQEKRGQIQQHLNVGSLKAAELPIPPITIQNEYVNRSNRLRAIKRDAHSHLKTLTYLFSSLQHRVFSNQL